jgi:hypothetical protein
LVLTTNGAYVSADVCVGYMVVAVVVAVVVCVVVIVVVVVVAVTGAIIGRRPMVETCIGDIHERDIKLVGITVVVGDEEDNGSGMCKVIRGALLVRCSMLLGCDDVKDVNDDDEDDG